jgi:hypothetical protein
MIGKNESRGEEEEGAGMRDLRFKNRIRQE